MDWIVLKAGSDTERQHLNKILNEIRSETVALAATDASLQSQIDSFVGDPWQYSILSSTFTTTSNVAQTVTGLAITPTANQKIEVVGRLLVSTGSDGSMAQVGVTYPTGMTTGAVDLTQSASSISSFFYYGNISTATEVPAGTLSLSPGLFKLEALLVAGATPSGNFQVTLRAEVGGNAANILAGSFIKWRIL